MGNSEKISIIVRSYNRKTFLERALESIRGQTYKNYEIIAVDDGSTDGSERFLDSCEDVTLIRENRGGRTRALNTGINSSSGEFIAFLDDDDLWDPLYLESVVDVFTRLKSLDAVHTGYRCFYDEAPREYYRVAKMQKRDTLDSLLYANFIALSAMVVRRDCLKQTGGFCESLNTHEDWDMWLRLSLNGAKFRFLSKNLVAVRIHPGNITADRVEMFSGALSVIEKNMVDLPSEYMDTAVSTKKRLANILGVVRVAAGDKKRGRLALLREFQAGDFRAVFYLLLSLLPLWALNNGINWYGKKQLTRVK